MEGHLLRRTSQALRRAAVGGCLLFRLCQEVSRHPANGPISSLVTQLGPLRHPNSMHAKGSVAGRLDWAAGVRSSGVQRIPWGLATAAEAGVSADRENCKGEKSASKHLILPTSDNEFANSVVSMRDTR